MLVELLVQRHRRDLVEVADAQIEDAFSPAGGLASERQEEHIQVGISTGLEDCLEQRLQLGG